MESYGGACYWERDAGSDPGSDGVDRRQDWAGREGFIFLVSSIAAKGHNVATAAAPELDTPLRAIFAPPDERNIVIIRRDFHAFLKTGSLTRESD